MQALGEGQANAAPVLTSADMMTTFLMLVVVLLVIFLLAWLAKRFNVGKLYKAQEGIQVINSTSVGPKERLVVIKVEGDLLLLGVTPQQVTLIKELSTDACSTDTDICSTDTITRIEKEHNK